MYALSNNLGIKVLFWVVWVARSNLAFSGNLLQRTMVINLVDCLLQMYVTRMVWWSLCRVDMMCGHHV